MPQRESEQNARHDEQPVRGKPFSPSLRWMEVACRSAIELLRLKQRAKLLAASHPGNPEVFHGLERETFLKISAIMGEGLGWRFTHNSDLPQTDVEDRFVYIANHPTLTACWPWGYFMEDNFGGNMVAVAKKEFIENPVLRWLLGDLMLTTRKGIFVDRDNHDEAVSAIQNDAAAVLTPGTGAVIFPDAHRPYPRRIRNQQREWNGKRPDLEVSEWMTETCFPKSGGLWNFSKAIEGLDCVRFLDCTVVEPESVYEFGGELHFDVREITRRELLGEPESEGHLRDKLVELWKRKNQMIRERR